MPIADFMLIGGGLIVLSLSASVIAGPIRVPALLFFLGIGMAIGSDGFGWIEFNDYELARNVGIVALSLILFEGGLSTGFSSLRGVARSAISLATVGTLITAIITGLAAAALFDFTLLEAMLLGSVVASTDSAAIFAVLRGSTLKRKLAWTLEGEAGMNDPVAVLLMLGFIEWIDSPEFGPVQMSIDVVSHLAIGAAAGLAVGWLVLQALRRVRLQPVGLYAVATIATAGLAYGLAENLYGSGFLAVYLTGLAVGDGLLPGKRLIVAFHEGLAWLGQIGMFLALGLLVFPSQLMDVAVEGSLVAVALTFVARPVAVWVSTLFSGFSWQERVVLSWAGLRGAVPVVLATFPVIAGAPHSLEFFNIVFFAVAVSALIQGVTFEPVARMLGVTTSEPALPPPLAEAGTVRRLGAELIEFRVRRGDAIAGALVRDLGLPRTALVTVIVRDGEAVPPRGSTQVQTGDELHVLFRKEAHGQVRELIDRWRRGPIEKPAPSTGY